MDAKEKPHKSGVAEPWNKGKLVGQKAPLRLGEIWAIRVRLELPGSVRDLALFNLAIDSKLRGCDLVQLKVQDTWGADGVHLAVLSVHVVDHDREFVWEAGPQLE